MFIHEKTGGNLPKWYTFPNLEVFIYITTTQNMLHETSKPRKARGNRL